MNHKKIRPLPSKSVTETSAKRPQPWWLLVVLVVLLIGYLVWRSISSDTATSPTENPTTTTQAVDTESSASVPANDETNNTASNESALNESPDLSAPSNMQTADAKAILNAPMPATDSLAKEEIDRLEDERQRLAEQEKAGG